MPAIDFRQVRAGIPMAEVLELLGLRSVYAAAVDLCTRLNKETPWLPSGTEKRNP